MDDAAGRFGLLEIDLPSPSPTPQRGPSSLRAERSPAIDPVGRERAVADGDVARTAGFQLRDTVVPIGTALIQDGQERFRRSRRQYEEMMYMQDVCGALVERVRAEHRVDIPAHAARLRVTPAGQLAVPRRGHHAITPRAIRGLSSFVTDSGGRYFAALQDSGDPDLVALMARNLNFHLPRANRTRADGSERPVELNLRTRRCATGGREVFAVVGSGYTEHDVDKIAVQVMSAVPPSARGSVVYNGYRATFDILFHSDIRASEVVAGELFKAGVRIRTADDGSGAITVSAMVWRNLCLNMLIIDRAEQVTVRRRHAGEGVADVIQAGIHRALDKVDHFARKWNEASLENLLERYGLVDPENVFEGLVANRVVWVPGLRAEELVDRLITAYRSEPGYSKAAFVNAISKAAHTGEWRSWETPEALEEVAGNLLFQRVWNVNLPDEPSDRA